MRPSPTRRARGRRPGRAGRLSPRARRCAPRGVDLLDLRPGGFAAALGRWSRHAFSTDCIAGSAGSGHRAMAARLSSPHEPARPCLLLRRARRSRRLGCGRARRGRDARDHVAAARQSRAGRPPLALRLSASAPIPTPRALERAQRLHREETSGSARQRGDLRPLPLARGARSARRSRPGPAAASASSVAGLRAPAKLVAGAPSRARHYYWTRRDAPEPLDCLARRAHLLPARHLLRGACGRLHSTPPSTRPACRSSRAVVPLPLRIRCSNSSRQLPALPAGGRAAGAGRREASPLRRSAAAARAIRAPRKSSSRTPRTWPPTPRGAAAVGLFDKAKESLARIRSPRAARTRLPHAPNGRFHLGGCAAVVGARSKPPAGS